MLNVLNNIDNQSKLNKEIGNKTKVQILVIQMFIEQNIFN